MIRTCQDSSENSCRRVISATALRLATAAIALSLLETSSLTAQERSDFPVNDHHIVYHDVKTDADGAIVPWYSNSPAVAYDHDLRLLWGYWKNMRNCPNGVPYYMQHQVWKENEDDPRGLGGDQINMALDSWNLLYGYLGDPALHDNMIFMANYWLDHGISKPDLLYGGLPYPYDLRVHSGQYDGDMRGGEGYLQPDKAGSFGAELVMLHKITGNARYLDTAVSIADKLAATVVPGDADHSPWPFRTNATNGKPAEETRNGVTVYSSYTSNWTPTLRLFDSLKSMHKGKTASYVRAEKLVIAWLKAYPLKTNKWGPFFEDIPTADYSDTEINADTMAYYLLSHPEFAPNSAELAKNALQWSYTKLANHNFERLHVVAINEQTKYLVPGNSHTSRHASAELLYCEKTGHCEDKQAAIRRLNWATYSVGEDGRNRYPNDDIWLTDGYGDYVRHYLHAMASMPELAPENQNHLLRTSSVIQQIDYAPDRITYRKFDKQSLERLKVGDGTPEKITGGTMKWDASARVLNIESNANEVTILLKK